MPQAPQLAGSRVVSTQRPLQIIVGQTRQAPAMQVSLAMQIFPQAPQLSGSSGAFTQMPPQLIVGVAQPAHIPFSQVCPGAQGLLQPPQ